MKKLKIAEIIDFIFINFLLFLILFTWLKFFYKNVTVSFLISLFLLLIYNFIKAFINRKKQTNNEITKNLENDIELYMYSFLSNTEEENYIFFLDALKNKKETKLLNKNLVSFKDDNNKQIIVCPSFNKKELKIEEGLKTISAALNNKADTIILLCYSCDNQNKFFFENLKNVNIKVYDKNLIFTKILMPNNCYPEIKFELKNKQKINFKQLIDISFNKTKAKNYFLSGLFIFFCSFIVKHNFYYVFMSTLLFLFALISIIRKQSSNKNEFF